jgi:branched-chain amino acid transport system substrate-binding protein
MSSVIIRNGGGKHRLFKRRLLTISLIPMMAAASLVAWNVPSGAANTGHVAKGKPIIIGDLDDTSGTATANAAATNIGIDYAVTQINKNGGVLGRPIKIVSQSDGAIPTNTPPAFTKLVSEGAQTVLLNSNSASFLAVKPLCAQLKVLCFSPQNSSGAIPTAPDAYSYIMAPSFTAYGDILGPGMVKAGYTKIGILELESPTTVSVTAAILPALTSAGVTVVAQQQVPIGSPNDTAQVESLLAAQPQAILVDMLGGEDEILAQDTVFSLAPTLPRFSLAALSNDPSDWSLANSGALTGVVALGSVSPSNPRTLALEKLIQRYQGPSYQGFSAFTAQGYDSVYLVAKAIEKAKSTKGYRVNSAFSKITNYLPSWGSSTFSLTFSPSKHSGANGICGFDLVQFNAKDQPVNLWPTYQPSC